MRRLVIWVLILTAVVGGLAAVTVQGLAWWRQSLRKTYLTASVSRGPIETVVNSTGTIKPVRSVSIGAFTSGPIAEIYVDFNSRVTKGQLLALIDTKLAQAAVDRDRAALESQRADLRRIEALLQQAKNNETRARRLAGVNKDYLSDTEMDQYKFATLTTEAQRQLAVATVAQADANLKNSEANLGYTRIVSPVDGIVIDRKVDPGQTVAASFQTPELFIVAPDMDKFMHVFASVDEADVGQVRAAWKSGRKVRFTVDAYQGDLFDGAIAEIRMNSSTTQNVVTYPVVVKAPNPALKLLPGMTANLSFQIDSREDVLRIPAAALRYVPGPAEVVPEDRHRIEGSDTQAEETGPRRSATARAKQVRDRQRRLVWVTDGELLRAVPVTVGLTDADFAEVVEGDLTEGRRLVTGVEGIPKIR